MAKYKILSLSSIAGIVIVIGLAFVDIIPNTLAGSAISILLAIAFVTGGLSSMEQPKEEEKDERKEPFIGY